MTRILVTGSSGFLGSHLVAALVAAGHDVTAFCEYNSFGNTGWHDAKLCRTVFGDIRDRDSVNAAIGDYGHDMTFHLAALIGIPYSYEAPSSYVDTNITGTLNVLQSATGFGSRVIITSTSEVYGSCQIAPMSETHPLSAQSPYAATKIAADQLALSFHRSFGTPVTIVRPFNTYGPRQSQRAVLSSLITQIIDAEPGGEVQVGSLETMRDWLYVSDTVAGFIAAAENFHAGEVINLCSGVAWKVGRAADLIAGILQKEVKFVHDPARVRPAASEVDKLIGDNRRAVELLGWKPTVTMLDGLKRTISWFRENRSKFPSGGYAV